MQVEQAQRDVREVYRGGAAGTAVSGVVWLLAAAIGQRVDLWPAVATLYLGGVLIYPASTLVLRSIGGRDRLPEGHPMKLLATETALIMPVGTILAALVALERPEWFFPFTTAIVGAHFLPFASVYGMRDYWVLAGPLVAVGLALVLWPWGFTAAAWVTAAVELGASPVLWRRAKTLGDRQA